MPEQRENLEDISGCAEDMTSMVDDMLDFSRLEAGLLTVERQQCSVDEIFEHIRPIIGTKAAAKQINLLTATAPSLPWSIATLRRSVASSPTWSSMPASFPIPAAKSSSRQRQPAPPEVAITVTDRGAAFRPEAELDLRPVLPGRRRRRQDRRFRPRTRHRPGTDERQFRRNRRDEHGRRRHHLYGYRTHLRSARPDGTPARADRTSAGTGQLRTRSFRRVSARRPTARRCAVETFLQHQFHRYDLLLRKDASTWLLAVVADWRELAG